MGDSRPIRKPVVRGVLASCQKVVVAAVGENRGSKDDRRDVFGLADDLRLGAIRWKVYKYRLVRSCPGLGREDEA